MLKNFFLTAYRNLMKNKVYTALNISGLAIGVIVCLLIGVWLQRELSFDKSIPGRNSIFRVTNTFKSESESFSQAPSGPAFGAQLPKLLPAIKSACRVINEERKVQSGTNLYFEPVVRTVDSNFFSFFGFKLKKGRPEDVLRNSGQIVLTEKIAKKYFGDEDPVGKNMLIDGQYPVIVSGIAEEAPVNSHIQFEILLPFSLLRKIANEEWKFDIDNFWVGGWPLTYIQLNDPSRKAEVEKEVNAVAARFSEKEWKQNKMSYLYFLQPVGDIHLRSNLRYDAENNGSLAQVNIFAIVGLIVLLLACINYINLTTAGAIKRAKETAVRKVVGALKFQLVRQFFLETLIICAIAVFLGVMLFILILPSFSAWIGQTYRFPLTGSNLLLIFGTILVIAIIAGIYPSAILSSFNPVTSLKGNIFQSPRGNIIRKSLVVFQFTITIALISSIIIISRQMNYIKNRSLGYNGKAVIQVNFNGEEDVFKRFRVIRNQLLAEPSIQSVSKHAGNIVGGMGNGWTTTENLEGKEISTSLYQFNVDDHFLETYDMHLVAGRFFSPVIPTDTTKAVVVNEAAVRTFGWKTPENALGKRFGKGEDERHVIGVVKDFNFENLHKPVEAILIGFARRGGSISLKIDAAHIDHAIDHLKKVWSAEVQAVPLKYTFVDERIEAQYGKEQKMQGVFYGFAGLSLLIACLGLFGLTTFIIERKVKEIGIRKVLGASVSGIVSLLSADFLKLVIIAMLIASPLAWYFMNNWLNDFAYRINIEWWIFIAAGISAILIALITISFRSIQAALANPVKSLRTE